MTCPQWTSDDVAGVIIAAGFAVALVIAAWRVAPWLGRRGDDD